MPEPPAPIGFHLADEGDPQVPAEAAVITPTIGRPELADAVRSVYRQDFAGRIQMLIGVDKSAAPDAALLDMLEGRPGNVSVTVLRLPYSTSARHGGVHTAADGGSLRTVLSFMANAPRLAYLDDDNEWLPEHLSALSAAIEGKAWAFSHRLVVDRDSGRELGVDRFDSVGVDRGRFAPVGGFVDPNCLMIDKRRAGRALGRWSETPNGAVASTADRNLFQAIRQGPHGVVEAATVRYFIRPNNILHRLFQQAKADA